jgi:hypothetical protein
MREAHCLEPDKCFAKTKHLVRDRLQFADLCRCSRLRNQSRLCADNVSSDLNEILNENSP